jgi:YidC/Oxa1 family membrane protein insertase
LQKKKRWITVSLILILAVMVLSGCSSRTPIQQIDPDKAGFWDRYFVIPLVHLLDFFKNLLGNYGLSILVVTFIIRLIIFPLAWKQQQSTRAMQKLQPEIMKIREKYKNDPQKMNQEMMLLYQKHGVNPMAGCLPVLIQFPILLAIFHAISRDLNIKNSTFLWLKLGAPDPYYILPLLAALTTFLQFVATRSADNPQMRVMVWVFPIMIFILAYQFPAALSLYWVYGNIFSIIQSLLIFQRDDRKVTREGTAR